NARDLRSDDGSREQRVFSAIFEVAPVPRVAREIDRAREHDVEAGVARFGADHSPALKGDVGIPGGGGRNSGWKRRALALLRRAALSRDSDSAVRPILRRDSKLCYSGHDPRRTIAHAGGRLLALP